MNERNGSFTTTNGSTDDGVGGGLSVLPEMSWDEIAEPGCYLHVASGHLARIYADDLSPRPGGEPSMALRVARLSSDPATPVARLRLIARAHRHIVNF